jgi:ATP-dependent Clp protease ATP-binding subunit ClpA
MFERFSDRARRVIVLAQEEARMLEHDYIGTEHILLGLIHEGEGIAATSLRALGIDLETVRGEIETLIGRGRQPTPGHIPFTSRAKKSLELALREMVHLGHDYIGTEHLLLGLIREGDGVAAQVLRQRGLELNRVRQEVIRQLHGHEGGAARRRGRRGQPSGEGVTLEEISRQLQALGARLSAIEEKLGVEASPARQRLRRIDADIARVRRQKESAIDEQDFERAAALRDEERELLRERRDAESAWITGQASAAAPEGGPDAGQQPGDEPPDAAAGQ